MPVSRYVIYFGLAVLGCVLDLWTKSAVFAWRGLPGEQPEWWIWEGYVGVQTAVNTGALFGMGAGNGRLFAGLSVVAAGAIFYWLFVQGAGRDLWLTLAMGAVTGGIFGNLYDRLGLWWEPSMNAAWRSAVRDWILLQYDGHVWPNFNIADSLLVCGAIALMLHAFFVREPVQG